MRSTKLPESFAADGSGVARLRREAQLLASLNHPHVASIYGLEEADGALALALELVEGEDLAQRLARGAIPVDEATSYARQLIDGLEAAHDPDPGRHRSHFYAHYANSVRGQRPDEEQPRPADETEPKTRPRSSPSWARLIAKVFQADPLVRRRCGGPLRVVAYITDALAIRQVLEHLDSSPPEKPPPEFPDVVRVPVDDEGREIELQPA